MRSMRSKMEKKNYILLERYREALISEKEKHQKMQF